VVITVNPEIYVARIKQTAYLCLLRRRQGLERLSLTEIGHRRRKPPDWIVKSAIDTGRLFCLQGHCHSGYRGRRWGLPIQQGIRGEYEQNTPAKRSPDLISQRHGLSIADFVDPVLSMS